MNMNMPHALRSMMSPRHKARRSVAFSNAAPEVRFIPAGYTSWPNGETSVAPSQHEIINAKALTNQAFEAAAAEERLGWDRSRTGRRPVNTDQPRREETYRPREQRARAASESYPASSGGYRVQTQAGTTAPSNARLPRKPVPGSQAPVQYADPRRSAPTLQQSNYGATRPRSRSNVEPGMREPRHYVTDPNPPQVVDKKEPSFVSGLKTAKTFAKKVVKETAEKLDARHSQNG
ncbi:hypothetical protein P153DRAFT_213334 [Dothidotthia symphoricarpi CBS 119687]|uniref:Uncharacterized protein n=1 Tax=Dothidotthia symphoricarpi CBS 119687 TaxID=1392245 RepID=A0A6A6AJX5_9PLEO|nr:uncharacterized protein P153DRAFT_213334 [Dothidotthia symphoricarpi CBS 119687]KAF2131224.1 hypothetical protein P153DRAFT_213334 [Dothidotthia symphoricarpi CBS 119687]